MADSIITVGTRPAISLDESKAMSIKQILNEFAAGLQGNALACYADLSADMVLATSGRQSQRQELLDRFSGDAVRLLGADPDGPDFAYLSDPNSTRAILRCQSAPTEAVILAVDTGDGLAAKLIEAATRLRDRIDSSVRAA